MIQLAAIYVVVFLTAAAAQFFTPARLALIGDAFLLAGTGIVGGFHTPKLRLIRGWPPTRLFTRSGSCSYL